MYTLSIYFLENPFFKRKKGPPIYKTEKLRKTCLKILFTGVPCCAGPGSRGTKFSLLFFNRFRFIQELVKIALEQFVLDNAVLFSVVCLAIGSSLSEIPTD